MEQRIIPGREFEEDLGGTANGITRYLLLFVREHLRAELPAHAKLDWLFVLARSACLPDSGRYEGCANHD